MEKEKLCNAEDAMRRALAKEPPEVLDALTLRAIRRESRRAAALESLGRSFALFRRFPAAACAAAVLGVSAALGVVGYNRMSANIEREGEMILEMTCMAEVADFYGEFDD